ncbi:universal stress protein [Kitasatospora sp. MAP5-34]|uniref:universal stress protein n=1 Tax=Kitasatospora sp. MAP5-34 TaxID=3035102 RepID=UPI0024734377|nr:universal stress protein [Kitasatospora sp. MAP5-34]MDH6574735.1 nucleotide-binding universal stress UspA family protein [Kitasatospora sp. MAP5-34]
MIEGVRVIVGVSGSLSSLAAVYRAVEEAGRRNAILVPVIAWSEADNKQLRPLSELQHTAHKRLDTVFEQAFDGYPNDIVIHPLVVHSEPGRALAAAADRPTDLLVLGSGHHGRLQHVLQGSVARYCRTHAAGEVLVVSPSELLESLELTARSGAPMPFLAGHKWASRHPAHAS